MTGHLISKQCQHALLPEGVKTAWRKKLRGIESQSGVYIF